MSDSGLEKEDNGNIFLEQLVEIECELNIKWYRIIGFEFFGGGSANSTVDM